MTVAGRLPRLHELEGVLDILLDERVGIVGELHQTPREAGDANIFEFNGRACNTAAFSRLKNFGDTGGASVDPSRAAAKAIGEAIERYCSAIFDATELPLTSYRDAPFDCIAPDAFALYGARQHAQPDFPFKPFTDTTQVRWAGGLDPLTNELCYVPAAMVFVPYLVYLSSGEEPIVQPISTGLACHFGATSAATRAICEVVERDAFMITWQARLSRRKIRRASLSEACLDLVRRFERCGDRVEILDMTMDLGVPAVLSVLRGTTPDSTALVFAGSADVDPDNAILKSLEELEHTRRYAQTILTHTPAFDAEPGFTNVVDQADHLSFWCQPRHAHLAEFAFDCEESVDVADLPRIGGDGPRDQLDALLEVIDAAGYRTLLFELTTPDVAELGLSVIRAVVPGLHPLFMGFGTRPTGGRRLYEAPQRLGYRGIAPGELDNQLPHPYP